MGGRCGLSLGHIWWYSHNSRKGCHLINILDHQMHLDNRYIREKRGWQEVWVSVCVEGGGVRAMEFVTRKGDLLLSSMEGAFLLASRRNYRLIMFWLNARSTITELIFKPFFENTTTPATRPITPKLLVRPQKRGFPWSKYSNTSFT